MSEDPNDYEMYDDSERNPTEIASEIRSLLEVARNEIDGVGEYEFYNESFSDVFWNGLENLDIPTAIKIIEHECNREFVARVKMMTLRNYSWFEIMDELQSNVTISKLVENKFENATADELNIFVKYISSMIKAVYPGKEDKQFVTIRDAWHMVLDTIKPGLSEEEKKNRIINTSDEEN